MYGSSQSVKGGHVSQWDVNGLYLSYVELIIGISTFIKGMYSFLNISYYEINF